MEATLSSFRSCSQAQLPLQPTSFPPQFFKKSQFLRLQKSKPLNSAQCYPRLVIAKALGTGDNGDFEDFTATPNKIFMEEAIGAEYGEGFETFRPNGLLKVDVDFLNDRLQEGFLRRIRYAMKPDEAYGLIFSWDNVVADSRALKLDAWNQLPLKKALPKEKNEADQDRLKMRLSQLYHDKLLKISEPIEGLKEWLDAVSTARIPCAVVSSFDRRNMVETLERMGLMKYFQAIVTEEDGMESIAHRFLSAAVKFKNKILQLDRKPSKCVVFEDNPRGITAAHNCTMMAVALIGAHPACVGNIKISAIIYPSICDYFTKIIRASNYNKIIIIGG